MVVDEMGHQPNCDIETKMSIWGDWIDSVYHIFRVATLGFGRKIAFMPKILDTGAL